MQLESRVIKVLSQAMKAENAELLWKFSPRLFLLSLIICRARYLLVYLAKLILWNTFWRNNKKGRFWCTAIKTFVFNVHFGDALFYWSTYIWIDNVYWHLGMLKTYIFYDIRTQRMCGYSGPWEVVCFWGDVLPWSRNGGKKRKSKTKLLAQQGLVTKRQEMAEDLQPQPKLSQPGSRLLLSSGVNSTAMAIMLSCHPLWSGNTTPFLIFWLPPSVH